MSDKQPVTIWSVVQWLAPVLLSIAAGWGSVQFAQGAQSKTLSTVERDVTALGVRLEKAQAEHSNFPSREEFKLMLDDLKEIKADVREIRRSLTK